MPGGDIEHGRHALLLRHAQGQQGVPGPAGLAGIAGQPGTTSTSPYDIVGLVDPCGGGPLDEILLRLRDGQVLAHYDGGSFSSQFLTVLAPGLQYITTDSTGAGACQFTLGVDGSVTDQLGHVL